MSILIFGDNTVIADRIGLLRTSGAHRIATHIRKKNIDVEVVDFFLSWADDELKQIIDIQLNKKTLFIGFSVTFVMTGIDKINFLIRYIKAKKPNQVIVVGGQNIFKGIIGADYYLEGAGEVSVYKLIDYLEGKSEDLIYQEINGLKVLNGLEEEYKVDNMTGLTTVYKDSDFIQPDETLFLETARGCIFKCAFCTYPYLGKKKLDYLRDKTEILEELKENYRRHGTHHYIITEDTINDTVDKCEMLEEIASQLPFKLNLMGYLRLDLLINKPNTLKHLVNAGMKGGAFGIETLNHESGKSIGKGMDPAKLKEGLISLKKEYPDFYTSATLIAGLPYETKKTLFETQNWIIQSKTLDFWVFNPLIIPKPNDFKVQQSLFSKNYLMHGYQSMSKKEQEVKSFQINKWLYHYVENDTLSKIILWKNKHFDIVSVSAFAEKLNKVAHRYRKLDGWSRFFLPPVGLPLEKTLDISLNDSNPNCMDYPTVLDNTKNFIESYKQKKLNIFYQTNIAEYN